MVVLVVENSMNMDDLAVHLFQETTISITPRDSNGTVAG